MRTEIPINDVSHNYTTVLQEFISQLKNKQKENLLSMYLSGSYARGDASDNSDLDVFCVFKILDSNVLYDVGFSARNTSVAYNNFEINSQCMSIDEFNSRVFENWSEVSVRVLDSILLYGNDLCNKEVSNIEIEKIYKKYLVEVIMSIRHYISVDEPKEKLTHSKIKTYIFKPLMFALRLERYCETTEFPLSNMDLLFSYNDEKRILVEYFMDKDKFNKDIADNHQKVLSNIHNLVCSLI